MIKTRSGLNTLVIPAPKDRGGHSSCVDHRVSGRSPVYVHSRTQLVSGFHDFVESRYGKYVNHDLEYCEYQLLKFECPNCGHVKVKPKGCKLRKLCPTCAAAYTKLKVRHAWDSVFSKFAISNKYYLMQAIFTIPESLRLVVYWDPDRFFKICYRVLSQYVGKKELMGGVAALHLSGDSDFEIKPHVAMLFPNCVLVKPTSGLRFFKRKRPYFDVSRLRWKYMVELSREYKRPLRVLNLFVNYCKMSDQGKVMHRLRYAFKKDIQRIYPLLETRNGDLTSYEWDQIYKILEFSRKRIRWFGFLADGVKTRYLALSGISYERYPDWLKRVELEARECPMCGSTMVFVETTYEYLLEKDHVVISI